MEIHGPSSCFPGFRPSSSTLVHWFWDYECGLPSRKHDSTSIDFFNWLSEHNLPGSSKIAEVSLLDPRSEVVTLEALGAWKWDWAYPAMSCLLSQIISEDLWLNPLQHYPRDASPEEEPERSTCW